MPFTQTRWIARPAIRGFWAHGLKKFVWIHPCRSFVGDAASVIWDDEIEPFRVSLFVQNLLSLLGRPDTRSHATQDTAADRAGSDDE